MIAGDFDKIRSAARDQTYPNQKVEKESIRAVDDQIFAEVRRYEKDIVAGGNALVKTISERRREVETLTATIQSAMTEPLGRASFTDEPVDVAAGVRQYNVLAQQAKDALASLERLEESAEWQAERLTDPYSSLVELRRKFFGSAPPVSAVLPIFQARTDSSTEAIAAEVSE